MVEGLDLALNQTGRDCKDQQIAVEKLQQEISLRKRHTEKQSCAEYLAGQALNLLTNGGRDPLETLEAAKKSSISASHITQLVDRDRKAFEVEKSIASYSTNFLKTASLFLKGTAPIAMGVFALDQIRVHDDVSAQLIDGFLGMSKGLLTKSSFKLVEPIQSVPIKGVALGSLSRCVDLSLTRSTYQSQNQGSESFKLSSGLDRILSATISKEAAIADASVFAIAGSLSIAANKASGDFLRRSPLAAHMLTGSTFGLTTGALTEIYEQRQSGQSIDVGKVLEKSLLKGALDSLAALPGGVQAARSGSRGVSAKYDYEPPKQESAIDKYASTITEPDLSGKVESKQETLRFTQSLPKPKIEERQFLVSIKGPEEFTSADEYLKYGLEWQSKPTRVYVLDGDLEIVVPEDYAQKLDKVRNFREAVAADPTANRSTLEETHLGPDKDLAERALPEDFISSIDRLPNKSLVSLTLENEPNPEDSAHKIRLHDPFFTSAATTTQDGRVSFYRYDLNDQIDLDLGHEWAHPLKQRLPIDSRLFDLACLAEKDGYQQRQYADSDAAENWAIHLGEQVLNPSDSEFRTFADKAPVRAVILGRVLRQTLEDAEASGNVNKEHQLWLARASDLQSRLPAAQKSLLNTHNMSKDPAQRDAALRLLVQLGKTEDLICLPNLHKLSLSGEPISDENIKSIGRLTQLVELNLSDTSISKHGLVPLKELAQLAKLDLSGTHITNSSLDCLAELNSLRELNLSRTEINDGGLAVVSHLEHLELLDVRGTGVTEHGVQSLKTRLSHLRIFSDY
jgi:hypothetical protein